ncbi:MAG: threonine synthase [Cyclobacteriaceae bacterium]|nr:threonine synthase [Cyclobacteriaceae bacterium]
MYYYSTNNTSLLKSAREAVFEGLPADNGLYMPQEVPLLADAFLQNLHKQSLQQIGYTVLHPYFGKDIPGSDLKEIIDETLNFPIPLVQVDENIYSLELYHGPTLAFKDVGARFMARCLNYFSGEKDKKHVVLVATSGDTGSAVAHGFYGMKHVDVVILYPSGMVSESQEKQMTTLGNNITALEVKGNFDDCQRMVKEAFLDPALKTFIQPTSANSINIARFLPQAIYYFHAIGQLPHNTKNISISVPSGNFGNLTAGVIGQKMGLPVGQFIASTNVNDVVPEYLESGVLRPRPSISTLSNAMDVGDPSNFVRIKNLCHGRHDEVCGILKGYRFNDEETREAISYLYHKKQYLADPHGAVGYLGLSEYLKGHPKSTGIFLETAHPGKFKTTVDDTLGFETPLPEPLAQAMNKEKKSLPAGNSYADLKDYLEGKYL